jgi:hypothetical protein
VAAPARLPDEVSVSHFLPILSKARPKRSLCKLEGSEGARHFQNTTKGDAMVCKLLGNTRIRKKFAQMNEKTMAFGLRHRA